ncbi:histone-lysine N-methyltransferase SETMAR-like [Harpegnathos saltator]|uniref:histone-lysine N-methyltransferase SETMAR-like n=1 Tax=Harpegnathos saltator TaxID=610380 RepID=UPI000DBEF23D|nr:histone-lysine N-methyltransferase SETMAR-like [Harpegnathos saltator]
MDKSKVRVIFEYEFRRGTNATQATRNINEMFDEDVANEHTVRRWFDKFHSSDFSLENEPPGRPETKVDNDELKAEVVEADTSQTTRELAASFMKPGQSITANVYYNQLDEMMRMLAIKQPRLVNGDRPILLQDNARPHVAQTTLLKLQELDLEILCHPPYSPYLAPTDYHFVQALDHYLQGKIFNSQQAVENIFRDFTASPTLQASSLMA